MSGGFRRRAVRLLKSLCWAFAESSAARVHLTMYQHQAPNRHPERVVPLSELPAAEQRWWQSLEERLR